MSLKEFFYFPKSDRKGIILALCVAAASLAGIYFVGRGNSVTPDDGAVTGDGEHPDSMSADNGGYYATEPKTVRLAPFDPNTADSTQLLSLGLQPWQVRSIYRYRAKGGVFREPEDFARLYGLTVKQYRELQPYIRISSEYRATSEVYGRKRHDGANRNERWQGGGDKGRGEGSSAPNDRTEASTTSYSRDTVRYPIKLKVGEVVELNRADTTMLKKVPGIGSYYARKVVAYRERLGGYYSTDQLFEIEGFPEEAVDFFSIDAGAVNRLDINKMSMSQLRKHPYINFYMAKAIADRRRLKGPLKSLNDLSLLPDFPPEVIERLSHYVSF